jgi:hypothetical protein
MRPASGASAYTRGIRCRMGKEDTKIKLADIVGRVPQEPSARFVQN